jgi:hypothetical protein
VKGLAFAAAVFASIAFAAPPITPFSAMAPGALPGAWRDVGIAKIKANRSSLVADEGVTVLRVRSEESAGTVVHALDADPRATPVLSWRWKVDRVVEKADMTQKAGDDYAARVYVFFDLPLEELSFFQAMKIRIVRALYGEEVPTAAICYVWDNRHPPGTILPNPYTERVRMFVLESGTERAGSWITESRDVADDYLRAFEGAPGAGVPRVSGIGAGADTDQTAESVTAWFGDFRLAARS